MTFDEACEMESFEERLGKCECGCQLKVRHEIYPIGSQMFDKTEVYCPECDD